MLLAFEMNPARTNRPLRIAVATEFAQRIGGTETYLSTTIPLLMNFGHSIALFVNRGKSLNKDTITKFSPDVETFACDSLGHDQALRALSVWKPDLIYAHGIFDNKLERSVQEIAVNAFFLHVYHGSCISGRKRFAFPNYYPCDRTFGPACLLHYHLRRCGGLNPVTMLSKYFYSKTRLENLRRFEAVITHSLHMYEECVRHGVPLDRLHRFHYSAEKSLSHGQDKEREFQLAAENSRWPQDGPIKVLFAARLDADKGSEIMIEVAVRLAKLISRPVELTVIGDGPSRAAIEKQAARLARSPSSPPVTVHLTGWVEKSKVHALMNETHLVAFASMWPEPFGLVGPEAAQHGKPVAAFNVGGVGNWLVDDVNGRLASGRPPKASGLAQALADCVADERTYRRLSLGALEMSERFRRVNHMVELDRVFQRMVPS